MIDLDMFLTILYVIVDDFCQSLQMVKERGPGRPASLQCSGVVTMALFGQWVQFGSRTSVLSEFHTKRLTILHLVSP